VDEVDAMDGMDARRGRLPIVWAVALLVLLLPGIAGATKLKPETVKAWDEYEAAAKARMQESLGPEHHFLLSDEDEKLAARLRSGAIEVSPAGPHIPKHAPSGLIHDWIGQAFIPNATTQDVLAVLRDYEKYKEVFKPAVVASRAIATGESEDHYATLLMNKEVLAKVAVEIEFRTNYVQVDDRRWYSVSESLRAQQIAGYDKENQHKLPEDEGTGLIWRTYSTTRLEARDGGVYIEVEAVVLSRDIPVYLRPVADPIVRRVSRESLSTSLRETQEAVRAKHQLRIQTDWTDSH
jgi:hypothetical protein